MAHGSGTTKGKLECGLADMADAAARPDAELSQRHQVKGMTEKMAVRERN